MAKETKKYDEDYLNSLIAKAEKSWEGVDVDSFMSELRDMDAVTIKCRDLMVGDWVTNEHGLPAQIINVDNLCAFTIFGGNEDDEGEPWVFDDSVNLPVPILLTPEILEKNGWKETQYWHEYQDGKNTIQCCLPDMRGRINGVEIENFKCEYVHQYQHLLRLCGLDELADNFKV